ncbi:hypothetical protein D1007_36273 [Hordeum vulgare]|nr:hypothetical protein D1007_36273 [Hordeum vulgare]
MKLLRKVDAEHAMYVERRPARFVMGRFFLGESMDPTEMLNVRFHIGGQFVRIGPSMDYVGGDVAYSVIERDKLSLQEVKGFLADHLTVKESMKYYFLMPGRDLINGLLFLHDDVSCMSMSDHTTDGGVADIFVEYNGEQDEVEQESGSDFEDEIEEHMNSESEEDMPGIMTAQEEFLEQVFVPNDNGVITTVISSPLKRRWMCSSEIWNVCYVLCEFFLLLPTILQTACYGTKKSRHCLINLQTAFH